MSEAEDIVEWVTDQVPEIDGRIYPLLLPAGGPTLPAMTYQLVSEPQDVIQDGAGLAEPRYRFKVWTETYIELDAVVRSLKTAFHARRDGPFRSSLVDGSFEDRDQATRRWWRTVDVLGWQPADFEAGS